ncbi:hypothetical protein C3B47_13785 [Flavobacterium columnare]|uniref:Uncharacterized protein n=2 Tax=Flavobacterium columnare TaxID=996 RepID=A0A2T4HET0_9FLAO|nr:hypothetical protein [Flavobacterium columnare]MBF6653931.1 hypothetical protein [Flavobacterium columnare]PTD14299.1 hypothetical protein C6N29_07550 [Flavobacterium columnare]
MKLKYSSFYYGVIFSFVILISCKRKGQDDYLIKWRQDSFACKNIRTVKGTEFLLKKYSIEKKNIFEVRNILGKPDKEYSDKGLTYLTYVIENNCDIDEDDVCELTIGFQKNLNFSLSLACN